MPTTAGKPPRSWRRDWEQVLPHSLGWNRPSQHLHLKRQASRTVRQHISVVEVTQFVVFCEGSPSRLAHPVSIADVVMQRSTSPIGMSEKYCVQLLDGFLEKGEGRGRGKGRRRRNVFFSLPVSFARISKVTDLLVTQL